MAGYIRWWLLPLLLFAFKLGFLVCPGLVNRLIAVHFCFYLIYFIYLFFALYTFKKINKAVKKNPFDVVR